MYIVFFFLSSQNLKDVKSNFEDDEEAAAVVVVRSYSNSNSNKKTRACTSNRAMSK